MRLSSNKPDSAGQGLGAVSIVLIRHGETALNVARVLQPADTPLSAQGVAQAHAVARRLAAFGLAGIVSSDLPRAQCTAEAIAAACGLSVVSTALLQERNFGELRGQSYDGLGFDPLTMLAAPAGGESAQAFQRRVAQAFAHVVRMRAVSGGPLAVVTHGLVLRALLEAHVALPAGCSLPAHIGNTAVSIVSAEPPHSVHLLACTRHLDSSSQDDAHGLSGG